LKSGARVSGPLVAGLASASAGGQSRAPRAEAAAAKAKAEHVERAEQAARDGKRTPASNLRAANIEVADAIEALEAARAAGAEIAERHGTEAWRKARAALAHDADAPLPI